MSFMLLMCVSCVSFICSVKLFSLYWFEIGFCDMMLSCEKLIR